MPDRSRAYGTHWRVEPQAATADARNAAASTRRSPIAHHIDTQARRLAVIRRAAEQQGVDLFINAGTDLFLGQGRDAAGSVGAAIERAKAYDGEGASGFFIPGLQDDAPIRRICDGVALPVNVMVMDGVPSIDRLSELGISRISYGPIP